MRFLTAVVLIMSLLQVQSTVDMEILTNTEAAASREDQFTSAVSPVSP